MEGGISLESRGLASPYIRLEPSRPFFGARRYFYIFEGGELTAGFRLLFSIDSEVLYFIVEGAIDSKPTTQAFDIPVSAHWGQRNINQWQDR